MKIRFAWIVVATLIVAAAAPVFAHHSFAAEYDGDKPVTLSGIVVKIDWANPHYAWRRHETLRLRLDERLREYECIENNEDLLRIEKLLQNESAFRKPQ